jgi:hypothetical protein
MPKGSSYLMTLEGTPEAVRFMEILKAAGGSEFSFFLASDWNSLTSDGGVVAYFWIRDAAHALHRRSSGGTVMRAAIP